MVETIHIEVGKDLTGKVANGQSAIGFAVKQAFVLGNPSQSFRLPLMMQFLAGSLKIILLQISITNDLSVPVYFSSIKFLNLAYSKLRLMCIKKPSTSSLRMWQSVV